jgi:hypothetical protein
METGKVEERDLAAERYVVVSEHARLKDEVLKIVKGCRAHDKAYIAPCSRVYSSGDLWKAVDALIAFEAEHKIGVDHETS